MQTETENCIKCNAALTNKNDAPPLCWACVKMTERAPDAFDKCFPEIIPREALKPFLETQRNSKVDRPPHYTAHPSGVECIQITEQMNFNIGNAIKYLWRSDLKNGIEDLEKARWYINREIVRQTNRALTNSKNPQTEKQ